MEQLTLMDYRQSLTYTRTGELEEAMDWIRELPERCELCRHWQLLPTEEQPPCGWGIKGQCNCIHEPPLMNNGYWKTSSTSHCKDFQR
jgi:hypothetical protein